MHDSQFLVLLASTVGVGFLMLSSGLQKSMLEWKSRTRYCPSCGRTIRARTCGCTSG